MVRHWQRSQRFCAPLMWVLLDHAVDSATAQRNALMKRCLRLFGVASIKALLADRAFVGIGWREFRVANNVAFAVCLRQTMQVRHETGRLQQFRSLLRKRRRGAWEGWLNGNEGCGTMSRAKAGPSPPVAPLRSRGKTPRPVKAGSLTCPTEGRRPPRTGHPVRPSRLALVGAVCAGGHLRCRETPLQQRNF